MFASPLLKGPSSEVNCLQTAAPCSFAQMKSIFTYIYILSSTLRTPFSFASSTSNSPTFFSPVPNAFSPCAGPHALARPGATSGIVGWAAIGFAVSYLILSDARGGVKLLRPRRPGNENWHLYEAPNITSTGDSMTNIS